MDELTLQGKTYVSSKRAAEITGYVKDYVGQLCREGLVEAKMVGRSWYVLESSIREHRFGKIEDKISEKTPEAIHAGTQESTLNDSLSTWEQPRYSPEELHELPTGMGIIEADKTNKDIEISDTEKSISDMQTAWKEWFEKKHEPLLESPEVIETREEEHEAQEYEPHTHEEPEITSYSSLEEEVVSLPLNRLEMFERPAQEVVSGSAVKQSEEGNEDSAKRIPIHIQRIPTHPLHVAHDREVISHNERPRQAYVREQQRVSIIATATLIAIGGLAIATALIGSGYMSEYAAQNPAIKFLGGESTVEKTNI